MPTKTFPVTESTEDVVFVIEEDTFTAVPASRLPGSVMLHYVELIEKGSIYEANAYFVEAALTEGSAKLFMDRLNSKENPITLRTMGKVVNWLFGEVYGIFSGEDAEGKE